MIKTSIYNEKLAAYADLVQYCSLVSEGVMKLKDGGLLAGFEYRGPDVSNSSHDQINKLSRDASRALASLGDKFMLHVEHVREPIAGNPRSEFAHPLPAMLDTVRNMKANEQGARYHSKQAMFVTWLPSSQMEQKLLSRLISGAKTIVIDEVAAIRSNIRKFEAHLLDFAASLRACGFVVKPFASSRLLSELNFCVTGKKQKLRVPYLPVFLDYLLCNQPFLGGMQPKVGRKHIRCLTVEGFPDFTRPEILAVLTRLKVEYRWSTRWIPHSKAYSEKTFTTTRKHWSDAEVKAWDKFAQSWNSAGSGRIDSFAAGQADGADHALNLARSGTVRFGFMTSVLVFMHEDVQVLEEQARDVEKELESLEFAVRNEDFNCVEALIGSLPGHGHENVRWPVVHTKNLADMLALHTIWPGHETSPNPMLPPGSPPLICAATTGDTPFRVNLHVGDKGHTTVIGPSGAGKSTLLAALVAQFFRYHSPSKGVSPQVFMFDKGGSSYVLCKAAGGEHYDLAADDQDISFAPLADIHLQTERDWATDWVGELIMLQLGVSRLPPAVAEEIQLGLGRLATNPVEFRTITDLVGLLGTPFPDDPRYFRDNLRAYCIDSGNAAGRILDAAKSTLGSASFQVFELDHLMRLGPAQVLPVLSYIFHAIERRLELGVPTLVILDEAWIMLEHEFFREKILVWMRTLRRANAAIVFATQNVADIVNSAVAVKILAECDTKIWLPNGDATSPFMSDFYRRAGLTDKHIEIIGEFAIKKRDYFFNSVDGSRLFQLALDPLELKIYGASTKEEIALARQMVKRYGSDDWVYHWFKHWGFEGWANYYERLRKQPVFSNVPLSDDA